MFCKIKCVVIFIRLLSNFILLVLLLFDQHTMCSTNEGKNGTTQSFYLLILSVLRHLLSLLPLSHLYLHRKPKYTKNPKILQHGRHWIQTKRHTMLSKSDKSSPGDAYFLNHILLSSLVGHIAFKKLYNYTYDLT